MDTTPAPRLVVQTHGMGVDSAAWLTAVLRGDIAVDFDLSDLVVVTAMTGSESDRTRWAMETFMLPLMREHGIRYVQLARASLSEADGITVLSDSRATERMWMRGAVTLEEETTRAGTIPQLSNRQCSYKFKGFVLDTWLAGEYGDTERRHVVGFAAEETSRARRDDGYSRAVPGKVPWYPLIELGWDRDQCLAYLFDVYGIDWPRSCCGFCPFQAGPDIARMGARWQAEPDQARTAVRMEANALALNPRMALFGDKTAAELARGFGLGDQVAEALGELDDMPARMYEVCRVYRRRGDARYPGIEKTGDTAGDAPVFACKACDQVGTREEMRAHRLAEAGSTTEWVFGHDAYDKATDVWRALRPLGTEDTWGAGRPRTRAEAMAHLRMIQRLIGGELEVTAGGARLWFERASAPYPAREHYIAVALAGTAGKERDSFAELWDVAGALDLPRQGELVFA